MRHTPYAILYGAEGADYPHIREDGPYWTLRAARAGVDHMLTRRYRGAMIVERWVRSDGQSITTGRGRVVEVPRTRLYTIIPTDRKARGIPPAFTPRPR